MMVLENLMPEAGEAAASIVEPSEMIRIGFFGQISALKGINVLFDAAERLVAENISNVTFDIFGDYAGQPDEFRTDFLARLQKAGPNVQFNGPYGRPQIDDLIRSVHAVLVPSVWWENSPLVIQEALRNRRPVICSGIGGMAEKVRQGVDGWHFPAGNAMALANLLRNLAKDPERLNRLASAMTGIPATRSSVDDFLRVYQGAANSGRQSDRFQDRPAGPTRSRAGRG
jgi:glycosyltransferase involved in cell wall biosynthesis